MVYIKQTWTDGVSVANAARLNHMEDGIASGGQNPWQFRPEDYGAMRDGTTDDTAAVQAAINAAFNYATSHQGYYGEILLSPGTYLIAGPYKHGSPTYGNAQLTIPINDPANPKVTLYFRGEVNTNLMMWKETNPPRYGTVFRSTGAGGSVDPSYGEFCVLGGPNAFQGWVVDDGTGSVKFDNIFVVIDGLQVVVDTPANQMGVDLTGLAGIWIKGLSVMSNAHASLDGTGTGIFQGSSNNNAYGLRTPAAMNNAHSVIDNYACEGMYGGLFLSEHGLVHNMQAIYCSVGIRAYSSAHWMFIERASLEWCVVMLDMSDGYVDVLQIDMEPGSNTWATTNYVVANSGSRGRVRLVYEGPFTDPMAKFDPTALPDCSAAGAPGVSIYDARMPSGYRSDSPAVPASGTAVANPFWRDCTVYITGGTVSDISIDGQSTGLTGGAIHVPTGKPIKLTYTSAPTWKWFLTANTF